MERDGKKALVTQIDWNQPTRVHKCNDKINNVYFRRQNMEVQDQLHQLSCLQILANGRTVQIAIHPTCNAVRGVVSIPHIVSITKTCTYTT